MTKNSILIGKSTFKILLLLCMEIKVPRPAELETVTRGPVSRR